MSIVRSFGILLLCCFASPSFAQKTHLNCIDTLTIAVPPQVKKYADFQKICIFPEVSSDSVYIPYIQQHFFQNKYTFVATPFEADLVLIFGYTQGETTSAGLSNTISTYSRSNRVYRRTNSYVYNGITPLTFWMTLVDDKDTIVETFQFMENLHVQGRSNFNEHVARSDFRNELEKEVLLACEDGYSRVGKAACDKYFLSPRTFPVYTVSVKNSKRKFTDWNMGAASLYKWASDAPVDTLDPSVTMVKDVFENESVRDFHRMNYPYMLEVGAYYNLAVIAYYRKDYSECLRLMRRAYNRYSLMPNGLLQLLYTAEVINQRGVVE